MIFHFNCSHCGYRMAGETSRAGQNSYCHGCSKPFVVPAPSETKTPNEDASKTPETSGWKKVKALAVAFVSKLKVLADALWGEIRRVGKLTALKAKIARLRIVDLKAARHAFGKKCYELGLHKEKFTTQFAAIAELEQHIAEKNAGTTTHVQETTTLKAKRVFGKVLAKAGVWLLTRKLKSKLVILGHTVAEEGAMDFALAELERVKMIQRQIAKREDEHVALCKDNTGVCIHPARYWAITYAAIVLLAICIVRGLSLLPPFKNPPNGKVSPDLILSGSVVQSGQTRIDGASRPTPLPVSTYVRWDFRCPTCGQRRSVTELITATAGRIEDRHASMAPSRPVCSSDGTVMAIEDYNIEKR